MKTALSTWLQRRWYSRHPVWILTPFSFLFRLLIFLRRAWYGRIGRVTALPVPVIVVGNLAVGGSGKTPFVIWLARGLAEQGRKPGIVTRGYGGRSTVWPVQVNSESDPALVGDEAVLLARRTGLPVVAGPDRVAAARLLLESAGVDLIVSDDGLQHYRLPRDVEIIMVDGRRGLGNGWVFPAGPLREPASRLAGRMVVLKTAAADAFSLPGASRMALEPDALISLADGARMDVQGLSGRKVHGVAAIADPAHFFATLRGRGMEVIEHPLPDHAILTPSDFEFGDGLPVVMTEKDAVKCRDMQMPNHWFLAVSARFSEADRANIMTRLREILTAHGHPGTYTG